MMVILMSLHSYKKKV